MFVFDTSAYINAWRDHYPPETFPSVWALIERAFGDQRVISPREVYNELTRKDDEVSDWAKERVGGFVEPSADAQREAGAIYGTLPNPGERDSADPWVVAEARVRGLTVVTYEGLDLRWCANTKVGSPDARYLQAPRDRLRHAS